jgi:hypothetical protein
MTTLDIAEFTCQTVGDTSSDMLDFAKRAIRLKYQTLYDAHAWRESMRTLEALPVDPALQGRIFLPFDAEEVIFLSLSWDAVNYMRLRYRERDWIERVVAPIYSLPGDLPWFHRGENLAWPYLNPGRFTFTTSDTSPLNVYIEGKDLNGFPVNESFILSAVPDPSHPPNVIPSSVSTSNNYSIATSLSKSGGALTVQAGAPPGPIVLSPGSSELVFSQFILYPAPLFFDSSNNPIPYFARIQVKLKADTLSNDMSVPRISHIWDALIEFTLSALYKKARQLSKAQVAEQSAMEHVKAAINVEKNQSEMHQQVIPTVYESGSYIDRGRYATHGYPFGGPYG